MKTLQKTLLILSLLAIVPISLIAQSSKVIKEKKIFQDYNFLKNGSGAGNGYFEYRKITLRQENDKKE